MSHLRRILLRILHTIRPSHGEADLAREVAAHVALLVEEFQRRGMMPEDARRAAVLSFGGVEQTKERHRDARAFRWLDDARRDVQYAGRTFRREPGFAALAVVMLALGIGASTAVFSITHAVLFRPLPYREPERLVAIWDRVVREPGVSKLFVQYRDLDHWKEQSQSFEQLAGVTWATGDRILTGRGAPRNVLAIPATLDLFSLLGAAPHLGRTFERADLTRGCTLVLTHRFWQEVLGSPQDLARLRLALDDRACMVAGVMPAGFAFFPEATSMWQLVTPNDSLVRNPERTGGLGVFGRLKPGVTPASAQAELTLLSSQIDRGIRYGAEMAPRIYPLQQEFTFLAGRNLRLSLIVLLGAVSAVLLIACVNVANLLLARSLGRQRELAVRSALGSSRSRLLRQLLAEGLALSVAATGLGTMMAAAATREFRRVNPVEMPAGVAVEISLPVFAFAAVLAIVTTVLFGLLPAWKATQVDVQSALKAGGRGGYDRARRRLARGLIVAEISLSFVLLVGAGLLIESAARFATAPLGFEPRGLMLMSISLPPKMYPEAGQRVRFFDRLTSQLSGIPEIQISAFSTVPPLRSGRGSRVLAVEGRPYPEPENAVHDIGEQSVTPDYFRLTEIQQKKGRPLVEADSEGATPVAIVNESLARKYFPDQDPIGQRVRFHGDLDRSNPWLTIVGLVADEKRSTPYDEMSWADSPMVYRPFSQRAPQNNVSLLLRARTDQPAIVERIQKEVAEVDAGVVVGEMQTAEHLISRYVAYPRFRAVLLGTFAGMALLLAVVGLYGVLSQLVGQRTQEIGVRMALGARREDVLSLVVREGMLLTCLGVAFGLVITRWLTRFVASLLFGVNAQDPVTLFVVSLGLLSAAFWATYLPARRAATIDPLSALRHD
jgi:predicted permease